ncbi:polysaccharide deacetylase family protein [Candidatus Woesearchaeota archaeon]|nr:polysaccharide deacetylase family protein [Candidatus Woesearchaeota archaeon]
MKFVLLVICILMFGMVSVVYSVNAQENTSIQVENNVSNSSKDETEIIVYDVADEVLEKNNVSDYVNISDSTNISKPVIPSDITNNFDSALPVDMISTGDYSIKLNGVSGKVTITNSTGLDGFSEATWNIWVKQDSYVSLAPLFSKYATGTGKRAYIIRTSNTNSISIILSGDGNTIETDTSITNKACGITSNSEWTMITITYDGSKITYYKNGIFCDEDNTSISRINTSPIPLTIGNYGSTYLNGIVDDATIYNNKLSAEEVSYLYSESPHKNIQIPVLVYHRFGENATQRDIITPENFDSQMAYIKSIGFTPITVSDYNNWKNNRFTMPSKPVIITFDDGHISIYTKALPIIKKYSLVGTLNVVTNYANGIEGGPDYMHEPEIRALTSMGWDLQSHSVNHTNQLLLSESDFRYQLEFSKQNITASTGKVPISYTFPYNSANSAYVAICGEYYSLCWSKSVSPSTPAYITKYTDGKTYNSLKRINIYNDTDIRTFQNIFLKLIPKTPVAYSPVAKWGMDEGVGTITYDYSGNFHHGQLSSGTSWLVVQ